MVQQFSRNSLSQHSVPHSLCTLHCTLCTLYCTLSALCTALSLHHVLHFVISPCTLLPCTSGEVLVHGQPMFVQSIIRSEQSLGADGQPCTHYVFEDRVRCCRCGLSHITVSLFPPSPGSITSPSLAVSPPPWLNILSDGQASHSPGQRTNRSLMRFIWHFIRNSI